MLNTRLKAKLVALFPEQFEALARELREETPDPLREGLAAYQVGDYAAALPKLQEALVNEPFLTQALVPLGVMHLANGHLDEAEDHLFQALSMDADNPKVHYHLGEVALAKKDFVTAEHCFRQSIQFNPQFTDAFIRLGTVLLETQRSDEATKEFEKAVYLDRKAVVAHYYLAQISLEKKDLKRALVQLHLVKSLKPDYMPAYLMAADIFEKIRDYRQVFIELKKVISLNGASGSVYLRLGKSQLALKNRDNALAFFLEARTCDPTCWEAYYHAATLQEDLNHLEGALQNYTALLDIRKYRETAQMAVFRIRTVLDEMRQAMQGSHLDAVSSAPSVRAFTGPLVVNRDARTA